MPDHTAVATRNRDLAALPFEQALDEYSPNFLAALPPEISLEHFKRMVVTAINTNTDLLRADRRSLFNACVKCASDGLLPDGREAALVVFKVKRGEVWREEAQYLPMVAGIRKRMRNSGDVVSATAQVVYRNDKFHYRLGDDQNIDHERAPLDVDPGEPVGAYAIITLKSGEKIYEIMRRAEIEASRAKSRAPNSIMWKEFWGEAARKTVLRRASKAAPQASAMLLRLLDRDEEDLPSAQIAPPPRPTREQFLDAPSTESAEEFAGEHTGQGPGEAAARWEVIDADGVAHSFDNPDQAAEMWGNLLRVASTPEQFDAVWTANVNLIDGFAAEGRDDLDTEIRTVPRSPTAQDPLARSGDGSTSTGAPTKSSDTPAATGSGDLFTQTDTAMREAAKDGLKVFRTAWLKLPQQQRDLVKPFYAEYEGLAGEAAP